MTAGSGGQANQLPACPSCRSCSIQKRGRTALGRQRYLCHCGTRFHVAKDGDGMVIETSKRRQTAPKPVVDPKAADRRKLAELEADGGYRSMLNQKPGKPNIPMLNRTRQVEKLFGQLAELLDDLGGLDPKDAASHVDRLELRDYSGSRELGEWWAKFADACEVRRAAECPESGYRPRVSAAKWRRLNGS